jgi:type VI secretion system protein ImpG
MDPRLLDYYERELKHVREMGGEFAREFPKIAGRLALDSFECADPYVERIIEAFAFLAARIQLRVDSEFPEFTQQLLELLYPGYVAPTPSMAVVQMQPAARDGSLAKGALVPRGTALHSGAGYSRDSCEFRTGQPVTLWPLDVVSVDYTSAVSEFVERSAIPLPCRSALRVVLRTTNGMRFDQLALDALPVFLRGKHDPACRLHELLLTASVGMVSQSVARPVTFRTTRVGRCISPLGFEDEHALLPSSDRTFEGHRLLQEYFAFPERFLFVTLDHLGQAFRGCQASEIELVFMFDRVDPQLEGVVHASNLVPFCTPVVNLFPRKGDRIPLTDADHEYHFVPDRTRPLAHEVHSVERVVGHGSRRDSVREFRPLYELGVQPAHGEQPAHFAVRREAHAMSQREQARSQVSYVPSRLFISLVDGLDGPFRQDLRHLAVDTLCTNRALPLQLSLGHGATDFTDDASAPVTSIRCVAGPTPPRTSPAQGRFAWSLLGHLGLDQLTIMRDTGAATAAAVRQLLSLYAGVSDPSHQRQLDGLLEVETSSVVRPLPVPGPMTFGRGVQFKLVYDEAASEGPGAFLLSSVLARFFAKYAAINSFAETVLHTKQRGEVARWPMTAGRRASH